MTVTRPRQGGKSIALALYAAYRAKTRKRVLVVTRAQFERFLKHGVAADQMRIAEERPKS